MNAVACLIDCRTSVADAADGQTSQLGDKKVLLVRELLSEGSYCIEERLDAILDRVLEDLLQ